MKKKVMRHLATPFTLFAIGAMLPFVFVWFVLDEIWLWIKFGRPPLRNVIERFRSQILRRLQGIVCPACNGKGEILTDFIPLDDSDVHEGPKSTCHVCGGTGRMEA